MRFLLVLESFIARIMTRNMRDSHVALGMIAGGPISKGIEGTLCRLEKSFHSQNNCLRLGPWVFTVPRSACTSATSL